MSFDHFQPPEHLSPRGKLAFRALCLATFAAGMAVLIFVVLPWANTYAFKPFADWFAPWFSDLLGSGEVAFAVFSVAVVSLWLAGHYLLRRVDKRSR